MPLATLYICDFCKAETQWPIEWMKMLPAQYDSRNPNPPVVIMCKECTHDAKSRGKSKTRTARVPAAQV